MDTLEVILEDFWKLEEGDWTTERRLDSEGKPVALVLKNASKDHRKCYSKVEVVLAVVGLVGLSCSLYEFTLTNRPRVA